MYLDMTKYRIMKRMELSLGQQSDGGRTNRGPSRICAGWDRVSPSEKSGENNLHSGPDSYAFRLWDCVKEEEDSVAFIWTARTEIRGILGTFPLQ